MALFQPQNSGSYTPADVERKRRLAEMLMSNTIDSRGPFDALAEGINAAHGGFEQQAASQAEQSGISGASSRLGEILSQPNADLATLAQAGGDPWNSQVQNSIISQLIGKEINPQGSDPESFFGNIVPFERPDGTIGFGQAGNRGGFNELQLPEGAKPAPTTRTVNTETEQIVMDIYGNVLSRIPIENQQAAHDTALGAAIGAGEGAATVAAPGDINAADLALDLINQIETHPELKWATGPGAAWNLNDPRLGLGNRAAFQAMVEQAKSGAFLTAIQQMRGLGSLSNAEGQTATAAVTRLSTSLKADEFIKALNDYKAVVQKAKDRALRRVRVDDAGNESPIDAAGGGTEQPVTAINPQTGQRLILKDGQWVPAP